MSATRASRGEARRPMARSWSATSSEGMVVGLQAVGDDVFVGNVSAELEVDGDGSILGAALLLADDGECARVVGAARDGVGDGGGHQVGAVQVEELANLCNHPADVA